MKRLTFLLVLISFGSFAQQQVFTLDDSLRGSVTPERVWWDLNFYDLNVRVQPESKSLTGKVTVRYTVLQPKNVLQIDLQPPLSITKVEQKGKTLSYTKKGKNAYFITLQEPQTKDSKQSIDVYYEGVPHEATNPPWEGGVQWTKSADGSHFIATSCQGLGASAWWPCKDHMYDEVDSMAINVTVPKGYTDVSNGRLKRVTELPDGTMYSWYVKNPINNYGVNINIAKYVHYSDTLNGEKGTLDINYYVLSENLAKAKEQFKQTKLMLRAFEHWFGPYPFYEDGFKLVEVPYLGMEHQSSVTYGNGYANGYRGRDLSGSGWGLKWDFIIIHESGHEWFANNITYKDMADMWIHESFTNYSESLYIEYYFGKEAATDYVVGTRMNIQNDVPIIAPYNVNQSGSGDMYYKGGNMLHTIRHSIDNDVLFRDILRGLNKDFYHQTVTTKQIEDYISQKAKINFSKVFDQYLRTTQIPQFEYYYEGQKLFYRYAGAVEGFELPINVTDKGKLRLTPTMGKWKQLDVKGAKPVNAAFIERMYFIKTKEIVPAPKK
jgi:aminopeptidase N